MKQTQRQAEEVIFGEEVEYETNIKRFNSDEDVTVEDARYLMNIGFLNAESRQNDSPCSEELIKLGEELNEHLEDHEVNYIGYIRSPKDKTEERMTLTGLEIQGEIPKEVSDRLDDLYPDEEELRSGYVRVWWD